MKMMSFFNFFFNPLTWVKLTTFHLGDDDTPPPQQNTTVTTNIPDYAQPYVENMLGAAQNQLFNTTTDAQGNTTLNGLKPYTPYSTNMNDYVAGFSPLQQQAQGAAGNLQVPGQYGQANQFATASGLGSLGTATTAAGAGNQYMQMAQDPNAIKNFMNPYLQQTLDPALAELRRQYGISGTQEQSAATGAGAFGGSREALMAAENQRNLGTAQSQMIGQGYDKAFQAAQQAQQYGSNLGLQGQQAALQGYGQAGQAAGALGSLGAQQLAAQQGIIGTQNQIGAQQTAAEQAKINQSIQDYANAQQYPLMELGVMSNMTRGLPLSSPTTTMYQAQPSAATQMIGSAGAIGSLGAATPRASGGILSVKNFDVGGAVAANLEKLPTEKLQEMAKDAKGIELSEIKQILVDRQMGAVPGMAPGGIVAFEKGGGILDALTKVIKGAAGDEEAQNSVITDSGGKVPVPSEEPPRPEHANRFASLSDAKQYANVAPGVSGQNTDVKLGADRNTYLPPISSTGGLDIPTVGEPPKELTKTEPSEIDKLIARAMTPSRNVPATTGQAPVDDIDTKLKDIVDKQDKISDIFAKGLNDIYKNKPELAPYAKERFDQFQSEIDGAKEKERQMFWLHSATMFATMATQPGGVIKAAMGALAQEIPLYSKDKEALEKHTDDMKKAQYDITQAEIARRVGDFKTSMELTQNGLKITADIYKDINKTKLENKQLDIMSAHNKETENIGRLGVAATLAGYNKPGETENLIDRMLHDKDFAAVANEYRNGSKEIQDAAKMRTDYDKWVAAGNTGTIEEYAATHKVGAGGNAFPGFTDKTNYKG